MSAWVWVVFGLCGVALLVAGLERLWRLYGWRRCFCGVERIPRGVVPVVVRDPHQPAVQQEHRQVSCDLVERAR